MSDRYAILVDKKVVPTSLSDWARWMESSHAQTPEEVLKRRTVARTKLHNDQVLVSTVFLGVNYGFNKDLWFETMVFGGEHEDFTQRYETYKEALEGHKKIVQMVQGN